MQQELSSQAAAAEANLAALKRGHEKALTSKDSELEVLHRRCAAAAHEATLARGVRDRAVEDGQRREEEVVALKVGLGGRGRGGGPPARAAERGAMRRGKAAGLVGA